MNLQQTLEFEWRKLMAQIQNLRSKDFTVEKLDEKLQCMSLIWALPEEYAHLSSALLLWDSLDKHVVLQAFKSEELNCQLRTKVVNRAARGSFRGRRGQGGRGQWGS